MRYVITLLLLVAVVVAAGCGSGTHPPAGYSVDDQGWVTTPSGLKYKIEKTGAGKRAASGDRLMVHYTGWLDNGTVFDSSLQRAEPFEFTIGQGQVIKGWEEGLYGLQAGSSIQLIIPPELGYGSEQHGSIPPNSTLHFRVEIISVN